MYTLHIGNKNYSSWSLRPWMALKGVGIPFDEEFHHFPPEGSYATFRAFSPTGLVPVLVDGDRHIRETLGIVEYLAERHQGVWAADDFARAWSRSAASEMHAGFSALRNICGMNVGVRITLPEFAPSLLKDLARLDELWADGLDRFGGPFLAGTDFTAIDAFFCPVAFRVQTYGLPLGPRSADYVKRLLDLPAMQEWYADALKEDFRDMPHENDHIAAGQWTADYRVAAKD